MDITKLPRSRATSRSVLIVDPDERASAALGRYLASRGWRVRNVSDGRDAFRACQTDEPTVVVAEVDGADVDGIELALSLAAQPLRPEVVLLTRRAPDEAEEAVVRDALGVAAILRRPCPFAVLASALDALADARAEQQDSGVVSVAWVAESREEGTS